MTAALSHPLDAAAAGRATGAMFFFAFGGLWLGVGAWRAGAGIAATLAIAAVTLALFAFAWLRYRRHAPALAQVADTPQRRRANRVFHIVNGVQWAVIVVLGNVLANIGLGAWVVPMAIVVIGLHFLPLAVVFKNSAHYATALALVGFGVLYPWLAPDGPRDPAGFIGTGLILWLSAAWALRAGQDAARAAAAA